MSHLSQVRCNIVSGLILEMNIDVYAVDIHLHYFSLWMIHVNVLT